MDYCDLIFPLKNFQHIWDNVKKGEKTKFEFSNEGSFEVEVFPINNIKNELIKLLFVIKDVTEINMTQRKLIQAEKMVHVGQMAAGIAHEIRNPLGVIKSYVYLLKKQPGMTGEIQEKSIKAIDSSVERATKIIDNLLNYSRMADEEVGMVKLDKFIEDILELQSHLMTEVIMISGYGTIDKAVEAMKKGAFGFFVKGNNVESLIAEIKKVETMRKLKNENYILKNRIGKTSYLLETKNREFSEVLRIIEKTALSNANVLIMGESGVGKEILVEHLHKNSHRKNAPLITVNCQAFSDSLLESELFGHEKGAFTGAFNRRIGRFEEASGGTFFLDEIGELSPSTQVKLLRTIENKYIERAGSNKKIPIDLRLVCATNKNLMKEVQEKRFREDLFYRINTISVYVPPLRNRREDLPMFIEFFFDKFASEQKKRIKSISKNVKKFLLEYDYPGNIRELKNIIERLVVLSEDGNVTEAGLPVLNTFSIDYSEDLSLKGIRQCAEKAHILKVLEKCNYNKIKAAEILDITSRQLYNKMVEYKIK